MPIEIKELHIKVAVNVQPSGQASEMASIIGDGNQRRDGGTDKDEIVAECVEQVLQILHNKMER